LHPLEKRRLITAHARSGLTKDLHIAVIMGPLTDL